MAAKFYTRQPIIRPRRRVSVSFIGNVINVDFGRDVRERNARWAADDASLRRAHILDGVIITLVVIGLIVVLIKSWQAA